MRKHCSKCPPANEVSVPAVAVVSTDGGELPHRLQEPSVGVVLVPVHEDEVPVTLG